MNLCKVSVVLGRVTVTASPKAVVEMDAGVPATCPSTEAEAQASRARPEIGDFMSWVLVTLLVRKWCSNATMGCLEIGFEMEFKMGLESSSRWAVRDAVGDGGFEAKKAREGRPSYIEEFHLQAMNHNHVKQPSNPVACRE